MEGARAVPPRLWRVGLYIRLSREDGRTESLSVQNQRKILMDYLKEEFQGTWELEEIFVDDGLTGTDDSRESFQRMIAAVKEGVINCVVCKPSPGRSGTMPTRGTFWRSSSPVPHPVHLRGQPQGGQFPGPRGGADGAGNPHQRHPQRPVCRQNLGGCPPHPGHEAPAGEFIGSFAPYGYAKDPTDHNCLVPDREAAQVVEEIFQRYVQGEGRGPSPASSTTGGSPTPRPTRPGRGPATAGPVPLGTGCGRRLPWGGSSKTPFTGGPWSRAGSGW